MYMQEKIKKKGEEGEERRREQEDEGGEVLLPSLSSVWPPFILLSLQELVAGSW